MGKVGEGEVGGAGGVKVRRGKKFKARNNLVGLVLSYTLLSSAIIP